VCFIWFLIVVIVTKNRTEFDKDFFEEKLVEQIKENAKLRNELNRSEWLYGNQMAHLLLTVLKSKHNFTTEFIRFMGRDFKVHVQLMDILRVKTYD
jgi:hypothetical protein